MKKYRKKPIVIEAVQWTGDNWSAVKHLEVSREGKELLVPTLEGTMRASEGDFIIEGVKGEIYPCKPDIFLETYEEVEE